MLEITGLKAAYGSIVAVHGISCKVEKGRIVCLIGPNGAGKTTTMKVLSGLLKAMAGKVLLEGVDITNKPPSEISKYGLIPVPEGRRIFARLTVKENLVMGAFMEKNKDREKNNMEKVLHLFPELKEKLKQYGGTLSGGQQQMLAIGRALMANPQILLMDEPSMGLAPIIVNKIFQTIQEIQREGTTILLVEQNANKALNIADYAYVLERGAVIMEGPGKELLSNDDVVLAYLGGHVKKEDEA